jgi:diaminopimelate decarboxylase
MRSGTYRAAHALPHLDVEGIDCHIGSQLLDDAPLLEALDKLIELIDTLAPKASTCTTSTSAAASASTTARRAKPPVPVGDYLGRLFARIDAWRAERHDGQPIKVIFEPGRSIVGDTGVLLTSVEFLKPGAEKNFCIVDAAMNDLMRPALYQAWMDVKPVGPQRPSRGVRRGRPGVRIGRLAGARALAGGAAGRPAGHHEAGAYGLTMSSNYNTRGRAAEVMVDGEQVHLIRQRENPADLFALESMLIK